MPDGTAPLSELRQIIAGHTLADEKATLDDLIALAALGDDDRTAIAAEAARLVRAVRGSTRPGMMESFLAEYGLTTKEGVALMCLAEALLRVPDRWTMDELIEDKVAPADWSRHLGHSSSPLVNASTWALMLTGRVVAEHGEDDLPGALHGMVKRLGEPVIRTAITSPTARRSRPSPCTAATTTSAPTRASRSSSRPCTRATSSGRSRMCWTTSPPAPARSR
jgi:RHH-type proline utilization regulon transcriptional repressor/proline dehydrogenase/delta 1-pyrroline-5-carboxylate dehydrogenase